ncbi:snake venom 5'-nucleotidase-like [Watersipora subatra]|uniref:snake venom 5'-nucleotidase-like n=1 Tax=Watersipora subatra TaxID=2589382 RepID=UPI00355C1C29
MQPTILLAALTSVLVLRSHCYELTILHTNDIHARIDEAHKYGGVCSASQSAAGDCVGGFARLYTKIEEVRSQKNNVLLLDGGDQFQGTFWFYVYRGMAIAQFMKKLRYDAMALGNHEFDLGLQPLQNFINNVTVSSGFEVLSSNIDDSNEPGLSGYLPYIVRDVGGKKIGIIGYTTTDTPTLTAVGNVGNLIFHEVVPSIRATVQVIKDVEAVDIIIALGHAGFEVDIQVAQEVDDVDIVVGGHTNTFLYTGDDLPGSEKPASTYPHVVKKNNGKTALCVQAYTFSKYLGNLSVTFNEQGDVTAWGGNPILLDNSVPKDAEVEAMVEMYKGRVIEEGSVPIARAVVKLDADCRKRECNFGNLVTDSWIHGNLVFGSDTKWSRASIALTNGGSIRAPIERGNITNAMLLTSLPFSNDVVAITITGKTLKEMFENSIRSYDNEALSGRFLQMSGAQVHYDLCQPIGNRVTYLGLRCLECDIPTFEPLDLTANYTLLTTSFIATGGDGYDMLAKNTLAYENLGLPDASLVQEYMSTLSSVYPGEDGRVQITPENADLSKCEDTVTQAATELKFNQLNLLSVSAAMLLYTIY